MKTLLIATRNPGKIREFRHLLAELPFELLGLEDFGIALEVEETGRTFEQNARLKAEGYAAVSGALTLADDSGLEVDALGGEPGVRSARYGGPGLGDAGRLDLLLKNMERVPGWRRKARFRAVIALAGPGERGILHIAQGVVEGAICHQPIGTGGFGYDPVFWLPDRAKTIAQLSQGEKNAISHRAKAAANMAVHLSEIA